VFQFQRIRWLVRRHILQRALAAQLLLAQGVQSLPFLLHPLVQQQQFALRQVALREWVAPNLLF
jgi:hypothetical protein